MAFLTQFKKKYLNFWLPIKSDLFSIFNLLRYCKFLLALDKVHKYIEISIKCDDNKIEKVHQATFGLSQIFAILFK